MLLVVVTIQLLTAMSIASTTRWCANDWPGHARFHAVTYALTRTGAALLGATLWLSQLAGPWVAGLVAGSALLLLPDLVELAVDAVPGVPAELTGHSRRHTAARMGVVLAAAVCALACGG